MKDLVLIGRFAQLTQLTIKALRLYDERGLLRPAVVDFRSGFRYYSLDQVTRAERIHLLRSLEMPLEEIRAVLDADDLAAMQSRLASHKGWIEGRIQGYQYALQLLHEVDEQGQYLRRPVQWNRSKRRRHTVAHFAVGKILMPSD